ncbi:uncharacterized protein LOC122282544 [Carya illinoinensis]|uniref:uncharacterized protein LOC122282544 n=1 Tax=Carya illinoinensis TaxID=32201 RepID=UPI001C723CEE|nr:uncharacterized protein LOC122282544 [Carya illinoinensis]
MDNHSSSEEALSIETISEQETSASSIRSHNSDLEDMMETLNGSGDEADLQDCHAIYMMWMAARFPRGRSAIPQHNIGLQGEQYIQGILNGNPRNCRKMFRMDVPAFRHVCNLLQHALTMNPTERTSVEESVGIFCLVVGHAQGQRIVGDRFQHSTETINRHVKTVMRALHKLGRSVIRPTHTEGVHSYIAGNPHCYPWFEFTYVYTGWEGTAHDARVFLDALNRGRNRFPWPPQGTVKPTTIWCSCRYYYLVDSAFPCIEKFMPPYPRERYHQSDRVSGRNFRGYRDYFNFRHSSLWNIIEHTFALLKNRFQILSTMPHYRPTRQGMLVTACCTLHNLIKTVMPYNEFIQHALTMQLNGDGSIGEEEAGETSEVVDMSHESAGAMATQRDEIAIPMWAYRNGQ